MEYRRLGASGLNVSTICLGALMFGDRTNEKTAGRIVAHAREAGVNFIDTADVYAEGRSERIVGKLIKRDRDNWVLATKVGLPSSGPPNRCGHGRKWIMQAIDESLARLGTDFIDVYYLHWHDRETPLEDTVGALADLVRAGKIRYWGFSNYRGWQVAEMVRLADRIGGPRPIAAQPNYNAINRQIETEYLPACAHYGVGVVPYGPLARGVLTAKYEPGKPPPKGARGANKAFAQSFPGQVMAKTDLERRTLVRVQQIKAHAEHRRMSAGQFAVAWVLNNALISSVIAGPRTYGQWSEYLKALDHEFTAADEAFIDSLVPPGQSSAPPFDDPRLPVAGRIARIRSIADGR